MTGPLLHGQTNGAVSGQPTRAGTSTFTVKVSDSAGATDTATFTSTVVGRAL